MLLAMFQDHRTSCSGEDFKRFLPYGHGGHIGHVTWTIFPLPKGILRGPIWGYCLPLPMSHKKDAMLIWVNAAHKRPGLNV